MLNCGGKGGCGNMRDIPHPIVELKVLLWCYDGNNGGLYFTSVNNQLNK